MNCATGQGPLTTGYYSYKSSEVDADTQLWVEAPVNRCMHSDLNKDSPGEQAGPTLHHLAMARAEEASRRFLEVVIDRIAGRYPGQAGTDMIDYLKRDATDPGKCHLAAVRSELAARSPRSDLVTSVLPGAGTCRATVTTRR